MGGTSGLDVCCVIGIREVTAIWSNLESQSAVDVHPLAFVSKSPTFVRRMTYFPTKTEVSVQMVFETLRVVFDKNGFIYAGSRRFS